MKKTAQTYLEHLAGMAALIEWLADGKKRGIDFSVSDEMIHMPERATNRFCLGIPKSKRWGKHPFFAVQKREALFFKLLKFNRAVIQRNKKNLILITSAIKGDGVNYPDIPPFAISMAFDSHEKAALIGNAGNIQCKGCWFNEAGTLEIATKAIFWTIPVMVADPSAPLISAADKSDGPSLAELVRMKIESTSVAGNPGFLR